MKRMTVKIEVTFEATNDMDPVTMQQALTTALWDQGVVTIKHSTVGKPIEVIPRAGDGVPTEKLL